MTTVQTRPPLLRPRSVVVGGVCAGLAVHLGVSERRMRVVAILLTFCGGAGALLYLWLWAFVPLEAPEPAETWADPANGVRRSVPVAALLIVVVAIAAVVALVSLGSGEGLATAALLTMIAASGIAVAWSLTFDRNDPGRSRRYGIGTRIFAALLPLLTGAATLGSRPNAVNALLGVTMVVIGVAVLVAPKVVTLWSDLMAERAARVRQEQRAEIAAHLHDSVLQTLALIQNRAGPSSEVARIARAQERELRSWLFAADEPVAADLATELRTVAATIELDYAVRIEVVAAGDTADLSSSAVVAATREAMLNSARHAGGEVSVYLETSPGSIDVFVRDRGPGVDLDSLPADRLGIRESIIGRMTRAGGTATVRPGASGTGTEVHLHLEVQNE